MMKFVLGDDELCFLSDDEVEDDDEKGGHEEDRVETGVHLLVAAHCSHLSLKGVFRNKLGQLLNS